MRAEEARAKYLDYEASRPVYHLRVAMSVIEHNVSHGRTSVYCPRSHQAYVKAELEKLGYTVEYTEDPSVLYVRWDLP